MTTRTAQKHHTSNNFDGISTIEDSHFLDVNVKTSIYYPLLYATDEDLVAEEQIRKGDSLYSIRHALAVIRDVRSRGLNFTVTVRDKNTVQKLSTIEDEWDILFTPRDNGFDFFSENTTRKEFSPAFELHENFSTRLHEGEVRLPNFAIDYSEYLLGAMIERVSNSYELYVTMFFVCHKLLEVTAKNSGQGGVSVNPEFHDVWKLAMMQFLSTKYAVNGVRATPPKVFCKISHHIGGSYYIVEGEFIPNNLTPDSNANKRLDILRCKMKDTERAYMEFAGTSAQMHVEVIRADYKLINFFVPWRSRKTGYMLSDPLDEISSTFDPWKGFNMSTPGTWKHDNLYMCVPGWEDPPSKASLPLFLEFFEHHLQLGVDHIFTGASFGWKSRQMRNARNVLRSYIEGGLISITSHSGDGLNGIYRYLRFRLIVVFCSKHVAIINSRTYLGTNHLLALVDYALPVTTSKIFTSTCALTTRRVQQIMLVFGTSMSFSCPWAQTRIFLTS